MVKSIQRITTNWIVFSIIVMALLTIIVFILYFPTLGSNFQGDDFGYLRYLFFNFRSMIDGRAWEEYMRTVPPYGAVPYFRPALELFILLDYTAWGLNPLGYHLTNLALHISTAFFTFILCWQLVHDRFVAMVSGLLFAVMPIHVEAVSWFGARADGFSTLWYCISFIFFVFLRLRAHYMFLATSLVAFLFGILTKEAVVTLPLMAIGYDLLYHFPSRRDIRRLLAPYIVFAAVLGAYFILRTALPGAMQGADLTRTFEWDYLSQLYVLGLSDPLFSDMTGELRTLIIGVALLVLGLCFKRREVWLGAVWVLLAMAPYALSINATIFDRYFYLPSIGLAVALASVLARPISVLRNWSRAIRPAAVLALGLFYSTALYARNVEWARAAQITQIVTEQAKSMHPTLPLDAQLVFVNVPVLVGGRQMQAFGNMLPNAMQILYANPSLSVLKESGFPIGLDRLDRVYFFEYNRRKLTERADLVRALEQRNRCLDASQPALIWNFSQDAQGWETWHDLSAFENRDGLLTTRATGDDPYMASPEIAISTMAIGDIAIAMRVRSDRPTLTAQLYWSAASQQDFSPDLNASFPVQVDGELGTYRVDIAKTGHLLVGDKIVRLRLDPTDAPADIAIKTITIYTHCDTLQNQQCLCGGK